MVARVMVSVCLFNFVRLPIMGSFLDTSHEFDGRLGLYQVRNTRQVVSLIALCLHHV
jgi:hypothetical protein